MKLYVIDNNNKKNYLNLTASSREELAFKLNNEYFKIQNEIYHVNDVMAESDTSNTSGGVIIGGLLGLLVGGAGAIVGGLLGGMIGKNTDNLDLQRVQIFNGSYKINEHA